MIAGKLRYYPAVTREDFEVTDRITTLIDPDNLAALHARLGLPPSSGIGPEVRRALESQQTMGLLLVLVLSGMQEREYRVRAGFRRWGRGWLARTKRRTETALALVVAARGREAGPAMF